MNQRILEQPVLVESTAIDQLLDTLESDTPPDKFRHFFKKDDLDLNLLEGKEIKAICGFIKKGLATPDIDLTTCPKCQWLYDNVVQPGDDE